MSVLPTHLELRQALLDAAQTLASKGLNVASAGNLSVRLPTGLLITCSGFAAERAGIEHLVQLDAQGRPEPEARTQRQPSSEWRFHAAIYQRFPAAGAVIHTHAPFATALACQRLRIPAFHYMIARFGGNDVRCAEYATFGTQALSAHVLSALQGRRACLLANHGMLVHGADLAQALQLSLELEALCAQYWHVLQLGAPILLSDAEMAEVHARFADYGSD